MTDGTRWVVRSERVGDCRGTREESRWRTAFRTRLIRDAWRIAVDAFSRQPRPLWRPRRDVFQTSRPPLPVGVSAESRRPRACGSSRWRARASPAPQERSAESATRRRRAPGVCDHDLALDREGPDDCRRRGAGSRSEADAPPDTRCWACRSRTPAVTDQRVAEAFPEADLWLRAVRRLSSNARSGVTVSSSSRSKRPAAPSPARTDTVQSELAPAAVRRLTRRS